MAHQDPGLLSCKEGPKALEKVGLTSGAQDPPHSLARPLCSPEGFPSHLQAGLSWGYETKGGAPSAMPGGKGTWRSPFGPVMLTLPARPVGFQEGRRLWTYGHSQHPHPYHCCPTPAAWLVLGALRQCELCGPPGPFRWLLCPTKPQGQLPKQAQCRRHLKFVQEMKAKWPGRF